MYRWHLRKSYLHVCPVLRTNNLRSRSQSLLSLAPVGALKMNHNSLSNFHLVVATHVSEVARALI